MLSLATNVLIACLLSQRGGTVPRAFETVSPCILPVRDGSNTLGNAVMIDASGYFVAHRSFLSGQGLTIGIGYQGQTFLLNRIAVDEVSGLILLQCPTLPAGREFRPAHLPMGIPQADSPVLVVMSNGPELGQIAHPSRAGVVPSTHRFVFLTEVKLENPNPSLRGAPYFSMNGEFLGYLSANLVTGGQRNAEQAVLSPGPLNSDGKAMTQSFSASPAGVALGIAAKDSAHEAYGPANLTVAYALEMETTQRVLSAFLGPDRKMTYPFIGVSIKDASGTGVMVDSIVMGSPGQVAGIQKGDIIFKFSGTPITCQADYIRTLQHHRPGELVQVSLLRVGQPLSLSLKLGRK